AASAGSHHRPARSSNAAPAAEAGAPLRRLGFRRRRYRTLRFLGGPIFSVAANFLPRRAPVLPAADAWGAAGNAGERSTYPIDQMNGGLPPAADRKRTGICRPQPAARPSNRPSSTFAQAG